MTSTSATLSSGNAIRAPFLLFTGDVADSLYAKTALGVAAWRPEDCLGQFRLSEEAVDLRLPDLQPRDAVANGACSILIGVAPVGGAIPAVWISALVSAIEAGLDIVSGMHTRLATIPALKEAAIKHGVRLLDLRDPPVDLPIATGRKRSGRRLLTVGTDCALGKKYSALAVARDMRARGLGCAFRASGQTGIMIAGEGIPIDAVVSDFVAGAAELLSPDAAEGHWDVIEGQGSLFHPAYAGVSLGLLHGSQPDAIVVCHKHDRDTLYGWPEYKTPSLDECIELHIKMARRVNADVRCVGVCINTMGMDESHRADYLLRLSDELGLPCVDPMINGAFDIVERVCVEFPVS